MVPARPSTGSKRRPRTRKAHPPALPRPEPGPTLCRSRRTTRRCFLLSSRVDRIRITFSCRLAGVRSAEALCCGAAGSESSQLVVLVVGPDGVGDRVVNAIV